MVNFINCRIFKHRFVIYTNILAFFNQNRFLEKCNATLVAFLNVLVIKYSYILKRENVLRQTLVNFLCKKGSLRVRHLKTNDNQGYFQLSMY